MFLLISTENSVLYSCSEGVFQVLWSLFYQCLPLCIFFFLLSLSFSTSPVLPSNPGLLLLCPLVILRPIFWFTSILRSPTVAQAVCSSCYFHPVTSLCHILYFTVSHIKTCTMALRVSFSGLSVVATKVHFLSAGNLCTFSCMLKTEENAYSVTGVLLLLLALCYILYCRTFELTCGLDQNVTHWCFVGVWQN